MNQQYFDVVVIGESLAGRIAAALLARSGLRLLTLRSARPITGCAWGFSSLLLEKVLDQLDGRTVLNKPQTLQFLDREIRIELNGRNSFGDEIRREFPRGAAQILRTSEALATLGEELAELCWDSGGLPLGGLTSRWGFFWRSLRHGLTNGRLRVPLAKHLTKLGVADAAALFGALLPALALVPPERLSVGEAALLWHAASRPESVSLPGLEQLLNRRYQQFHGGEEDLAILDSVTPGSRQPYRLQLKGQRQIAAGCLIVADPAMTGYLPEAWRSSAPAQPLPGAVLQLTGEVSPVLSEQVVLAGQPPLRLAFSGAEKERRVVVEAAGAISAAELTERLHRLCPFAGLNGEPLTGSVAATQPSGLSTAIARAAGGPGLFYCSATVLPALGCTGEALTALSVATAIRQRLKKPAA